MSRIIEKVQQGDFDLKKLLIGDKEAFLEVKTALENISNNLPKETCAKFLADKIVPYIYDENITDETREQVLELGFYLLDYVNITDLPDNNQEKLLKSIEDRYIQFVQDCREKDGKFWDKLWIFLIKLSNVRIHTKMCLANKLLRVVEKAFRNSTSLEQRIQAYDCWTTLIDNSSLNMTHMTSLKQIKLLVTPMKAKFSRTPVVITKRFDTFLYLLKKLQEKSTLCLREFLEFCFAPFDNGDVDKLRQGKSVPQVCEKSCAVLMDILGHEHDGDDCIKADFINFPEPVVNSLNFSCFIDILVKSVGECCILLNDWNEKPSTNHTIVRCLWRSLLKLVKNSDVENQTKACVTISVCLRRILSFLQGTENIQFYRSILGNIIELLIDSEFIESLKNIVFDAAINILHGDSEDDSDFNTDKILTFVVSCFDGDEGQKFSKITSNFFHSHIKQQSNKAMCEIWLKCPFAPTHNYLNLLWPVRHLPNFTDKQALFTKWTKIFNSDCKYESVKLQFLQELEKLFLDNPLFSRNIVPFLGILSLADNSTKDYVTKLMRLISTILTYPNLCEENVKKLSEIILATLDPNISIYNQPENCEETINKLCGCLEQILIMHKNYEILPELITSLRNFSEKQITYFSNCMPSFLQTLMLSEDINVVTQSRKLLEILDSKQPEPDKIPVTTPRSLRMINMTSKSPKLINNQSKVTSLKLFGKDIESSTPLQVKGSQIGHTVSKRSQIIMNNSPANRSRRGRKKFAAPQDEEKSSDYVKIDSVVKFEPSKLNEHQKEVLKKRREDIPALYQDLSQSQSMGLNSESSSKSSQDVFKSPPVTRRSVSKDEEGETKITSTEELSISPRSKLRKKMTEIMRQETLPTKNATPPISTVEDSFQHSVNETADESVILIENSSVVEQAKENDKVETEKIIAEQVNQMRKSLRCPKRKLLNDEAIVTKRRRKVQQPQNELKETNILNQSNEAREKDLKESKDKKLTQRSIYTMFDVIKTPTKSTNTEKVTENSTPSESSAKIQEFTVSEEGSSMKISEEKTDTTKDDSINISSTTDKASDNVNNVFEFKARNMSPVNKPRRNRITPFSRSTYVTRRRKRPKKNEVDKIPYHVTADYSPPSQKIEVFQSNEKTQVSPVAQKVNNNEKAFTEESENIIESSQDVASEVKRISRASPRLRRSHSLDSSEDNGPEKGMKRCHSLDKMDCLNISVDDLNKTDVKTVKNNDKTRSSEETASEESIKSSIRKRKQMSLTSSKLAKLNDEIALRKLQITEIQDTLTCNETLTESPVKTKESDSSDMFKENQPETQLTNAESLENSPNDKKQPKRRKSVGTPEKSIKTSEELLADTETVKNSPTDSSESFFVKRITRRSIALNKENNESVDSLADNLQSLLESAKQMKRTSPSMNKKTSLPDTETIDIASTLTATPEKSPVADSSHVISETAEDEGKKGATDSNESEIERRATRSTSLEKSPTCMAGEDQNLKKATDSNESDIERRTTRSSSLEKSPTMLDSSNRRVTRNSSSPIKSPAQKSLDFTTLTNENSKVEAIPISPIKPLPDTLSLGALVQIEDCPSPISKIQAKDDLPGSPVTCDTPNKTNELLNSTFDISPITSSGGSSDDVPVVATTPQIRTNLRGSRLLQMVNSNVSVESPVGKWLGDSKKDTTKSGKNERAFASPSVTGKVRKMKMKVQREDNLDFLTFSRQIPSPLIVPASGILKRKFRELDETTTITPSPKRKRVNFCDPAITQKKLFIKDTAEYELQNENGKESEVPEEVIADFQNFLQRMKNKHPSSDCLSRLFLGAVNKDEIVQYLIESLDTPDIVKVISSYVINLDEETLNELDKELSNSNKKEEFLSKCVWPLIQKPDLFLGEFETILSKLPEEALEAIVKKVVNIVGLEKLKSYLSPVEDNQDGIMQEEEKPVEKTEDEKLSELKEKREELFNSLPEDKQSQFLVDMLNFAASRLPVNEENSDILSELHKNYYKRIWNK